MTTAFSLLTGPLPLDGMAGLTHDGRKVLWAEARRGELLNRQETLEVAALVHDRKQGRVSWYVGSFVETGLVCEFHSAMDETMARWCVHNQELVARMQRAKDIVDAAIEAGEVTVPKGRVVQLFEMADMVSLPETA